MRLPLLPVVLATALLPAAPAAPVAGAAPVETRRSIGGLAAHVAGMFDEITACHIAPDGHYLLFDRRAHAVYSIAPGADLPTKIVQIGAEAGRILRPTSFDSAPDGSFVVADTPGKQQRIQFFKYPGETTGGFTIPGPRVPQITMGDLVLSGIGSLKYTGHSILVSQPETGALVTEYLLNGETARTFGALRPTGQERDALVHAALNVGLALPIRTGGFYFVFLSGVPMFRKYDATGGLVFERHIEGVEIDPYLRELPTTWATRRPGSTDELPIVPATIRTAAVDPDGNLWISLLAPVTYVYDSGGDKRQTLEFRGAGTMAARSFFFTRDGRVLVTPGCYAFPAK